MPGPAILLLLRAAATVGRAAAVGTRAAAARMAAAARVLARAGARLASKTLSRARSIAKSALRGSRALILKAYRALRFGAWLIRRLTREFISRAFALYIRLRSKAEHLYHMLGKSPEKQLVELVRRAFFDAVAQSKGEFTSQLEDALNNPTYDKSERLLAIDLHRQNALKKYTQLVDFVVSETEMSDEEIVDQMLREVAPEVVAARILSIGDPTAALDVDAEEHIARMATEFLNFVHRVRENADTMNRMRIVQYLLDQTEKASKAASFRQTLLSQLVRDKIFTDIDNVSFGALSNINPDDVDGAERAAKALSNINLGSPDVERNSVIGEVLHSIANMAWKGGLTVLTEFAVAALRQERLFAFEYLRIVREARTRISRLVRPYSAHHIDEDAETVDPGAMRKTDEELIDEGIAAAEPPPIPGEEEQQSPGDLEAEEENDITFGVWTLNARRMTQYHCPDCEALAALTEFAPVPIHQLPQPGTETECGSMCGCDIVEVTPDEHDQSYQNWSSIYKQVFDQALPAKFDEIPREIMPSLLHYMSDDYEKAVKWAKRLQIV